MEEVKRDEMNRKNGIIEKKELNEKQKFYAKIALMQQERAREILKKERPTITELQEVQVLLNSAIKAVYWLQFNEQIPKLEEISSE